MDYEEFLRNKSQVSGMSGFEPTFMPEVMFPFQKHLTEWAVRKGRAAIFADCGLGKTLMSLVWAENVVRHTGGKVLILAPLAVAPQTLREATKFGLEIHHSRDGMARGSITVSNYESLHKFRADDLLAWSAMRCRARRHLTESVASKSRDSFPRCNTDSAVQQQRLRMISLNSGRFRNCSER